MQRLERSRGLNLQLSTGLIALLIMLRRSKLDLAPAGALKLAGNASHRAVIATVASTRRLRFLVQQITPSCLIKPK